MTSHARSTAALRGVVWVVLTLVGSTAALAQASESETMSRGSGFVMAFAKAVGALRELFLPILATLPRVPGDVAAALAALIAGAEAGAALPIGKALLIDVALFLVPVLMRLALRFRARPEPADPVGRLWRRLFFDLRDALWTVLLGGFLVHLSFGGTSLIEGFAICLVDLALRVRLALILLLVLLRPGEPELRLIPAEEVQVKRALPILVALIVLVTAFVTIVPVLLLSTLDLTVAQAFGLATGVVVGLGGAVAAQRFLAASPVPRPRAVFAANLGILAFWLAWTYGVAELDFPFYFAVIHLLEVVTIAVVVDRVLAIVIGHFAERDQRLRVVPFSHHLARGARRASQLLAGAALAGFLVDFLAEDFPNLLSAARWQESERAVIIALVTVTASYVMFELIRAWTNARFGTPQTGPMPGEDEEFNPASRLSTIMPIIQGFAGVAILGTAGLVALSQLGVNTAPLLAGFGIFGLALSFGSQALVRDIVAGIFYMADDAFRIGEYIEAGRLKGTVERISLRSLRLRHHNGQIHTVPFGQLGSVTNYSRDWITVKFNLRLARDTDIEQVRKTVKRIGQDMLNDPEVGRELIQPLKLQGVADIVENALVLRFKFTVRPGKPTVVQRDAVKRMVQVFAEKGIRFASHSVTVRGVGGDAEEIKEEEGAAALSTVIQPELSRPAQTA